MVIIIDKIITPYEVARYNEINKILKGNLEVWFLQKTENNRQWRYFPEINFKYRVLKSKYLEIIWLLTKYKNRIDRIICCGWSSFAYLYAFIFCKLNNKKFTLWSGSTIYEKSWKRLFFYPIIKIIVHFSDDYIAYGARAKEYLSKLGAQQSKIKIFLNSVDVDFFVSESQRLKAKRSDLRKKYGIDLEAQVILYVGQLIKRKGIIELLYAFAELSKKYQNLKLIIVGTGELREKIKLFKKEKSISGIKIFGFIQYNKLPEIYAISDALILPSKEEVWGLVVNEALASGLPVLVSKFAGCSRDLVTSENGIIIDKITKDGIKKAIEKFMKQRNFRLPLYILQKMHNQIYAKKVFTN